MHRLTDVAHIARILNANINLLAARNGMVG